MGLLTPWAAWLAWCPWVLLGSQAARKLRFSSPELEGRFQEQQAAELAQMDAHVSLAFSTTCLLGCVHLCKQAECTHWHGMAAVVVSAVWLAPWALCRCAPALYVRHRRLWLLLHRLAVLSLPEIDLWVGHYKLGMQASPSRVLSIILLAANLGSAVMLSLGLRLDLETHLQVHALFALRTAARSKVLCLTRFAQSPGALRVFWAFATRLTRWAEALLLPVRWGPADDPPPQPQQCYTLVLAAHLLLGFLICSVSVWIEERRSRAQFLRLTAAAAGVDVAALDRRLRLAPDEGAAVCSFNPRAAWQRFLLLLPLLAALLWLLVTEAAAHWVPHVPGGGLGQCPAAAAP